MEARPKNKSLTGLAEAKLDKLDDIYRALQNIDQRQKSDWETFLKKKRRQVWIAFAMALIGGASLYYEIVRIGDIDIFKQRFAELKKEVSQPIELDKPQLLAGVDE